MGNTASQVSPPAMASAGSAEILNSTRGQDEGSFQEEPLGVLFPEGSELQLREGNKVDPIPSPRASEQSQYSQILHSEEFKSHLFKNLDKVSYFLGLYIMKPLYIYNLIRF